MKIRTIALAFLVVLFAGCSKPGRPGRSSGKVTKPISVMTEVLTPQSIEDFVTITGTLEGKTEVVMMSEVSGRVKQVNVSLGQWIDEGQSVAELDAPQYQIQLDQARASFLAAKAALEAAELNNQSAQTLYEKQAISQGEYKQTLSNYTSAQAAYQGSQANLEMARNTLESSRFCAPVSGWISYLPIQKGEYLKMNTAMCKIVDDRQMIIHTRVGENEVTSLQPGMSAIIITKASKGMHPAKIAAIGKSPAPGSVLYPLDILVQNPQRELLSGMMVSVQILRDTFDNVLATSVENLRQSYDDHYLYVATPANTAEKRVVTIGEQIDGKVIITSGVKAGEQVISEGLDSISDGAAIEIRAGETGRE